MDALARRTVLRLSEGVEVRRVQSQGLERGQTGSRDDLGELRADVCDSRGSGSHSGDGDEESGGLLVQHGD